MQGEHENKIMKSEWQEPKLVDLMEIGRLTEGRPGYTTTQKLTYSIEDVRDGGGPIFYGPTS